MSIRSSIVYLLSLIIIYSFAAPSYSSSIEDDNFIDLDGLYKLDYKIDDLASNNFELSIKNNTQDNLEVAYSTRADSLIDEKASADLVEKTILIKKGESTESPINIMNRNLQPHDDTWVRIKAFAIQENGERILKYDKIIAKDVIKIRKDNGYLMPFPGPIYWYNPPRFRIITSAYLGLFSKMDAGIAIMMNRGDITKLRPGKAGGVLLTLEDASAHKVIQIPFYQQPVNENEDLLAEYDMTTSKQKVVCQFYNYNGWIEYPLIVNHTHPYWLPNAPFDVTAIKRLIINTEQRYCELYTDTKYTYYYKGTTVLQKPFLSPEGYLLLHLDSKDSNSSASATCVYENDESQL